MPHREDNSMGGMGSVLGVGPGVPDSIPSSGQTLSFVTPASVSDPDAK